MGQLLTTLWPARKETREGSVADVAALLVRSNGRVCVLTGAGVSKESGIPTFRDPADGLWLRYDVRACCLRAACLRVLTQARYPHSP